MDERNQYDGKLEIAFQSVPELTHIQPHAGYRVLHLHCFVPLELFSLVFALGMLSGMSSLSAALSIVAAKIQARTSTL